MERRDDAAAFPASTVPREHEEKNLSKPHKETTARKTAKARHSGGLFGMYGKTSCRKNLSSPLALLPDQRRQEGRPPAFPAPSQAGAQDTRRELQDFRSYACGCAPNVQLLRKKEPTTPHESETPQRPSEDTGDGRQEANYGGPASSHPPDERVLGKEGGV